ncbi:FAD-dependent oxidoreductase [Prosthecobacter dejongeii]|uniref:2-polyprenyl-6-methoxyphenol hydroxylase-like FAD-dependent oxidoreductase n=1 Tax=Prosthecobacter dejongeii TaxID=48465 RepID=A0A7W7YIU1_9BACT|nr:NAD(P)/FAD-dependent oxidoreductase [Prosthecobacter dejongeii]MBB5036973.1 2-polyprenyl-6-methoxyphenol hydroxylase-like FAD-dependent oxidoreductase [Prosthecobacter dejongeii]
MPTPLRIAIVGSGTAGPAASLFLARAGHAVTLFERAVKTLPVGAGFLLQPTGLAVLERLGLRTELLPHTAAVSRLYCQTHRGRVLLDLSYQELGPSLHGAGTHRATFLDMLLKAMPQAGATQHWGITIQSLTRDSTGRPLLHDTADCTHGPYDLLLICDGAQSILRAQCGIPARVRRYPWGALWFIGKRTAEFHPQELWQCVGSTRELNGYLPTGTQEDLLSLFWSLRLDAMPAWKNTPLNTWKQQILRLTPQAEPFLQQIESHQQVATATYHDVTMRQWHGERIAILGDAAHALSPQLGQGVNLALMDAAALADAMAQYPLEKALPHYSETRRRHLRFYQFATRWSTPFFQSDLLPLGWLRDLTFPLMHQLPWMRRQMVATMAGGKTGPFSEMRL